jgi:dienelactone hydrolase
MHLLDRLIASALPRGRFFRSGWGDQDLLGSLAEDDLASVPVDTEVMWRPPRRFGDLVVQDGAFESPEQRLPRAVRLARVRRLGAAGVEPRAAVVLLAASGDQGYRARTALVRPLLARGLAVLLLENPYYGARRPADQDGVALPTVSDFALMAVAVVKEAKALLAVARRDVPRTCVAGYSMGGNLAAVVAATVPFAVGAVPLAPSASPAPVFTDGVLRVYPALGALAGHDEGPEEARTRLRTFLARFDVTRLSRPRAPHAAIVVGTKDDGFVPPSEMRRLAAHWSCELRWLQAGHASGYLFHRAAMRQALLDAISRLRDEELAPRPYLAPLGASASSR